MKCLFHHPIVYGVSRNFDDLPMRPGSELCKHYLMHGTCSYGPACMLHHPNIAPKEGGPRGPMGGMRGGPGRGGMHMSPGRGGPMGGPWSGRGPMDTGRGDMRGHAGHPHLGGPGRGGGGMMHGGRGAPGAAGPMHFGGGGAPMGPNVVMAGAHMAPAPRGAGPMILPQQAVVQQQQFGAPAQMYRM